MMAFGAAGGFYLLFYLLTMVFLIVNIFVVILNEFVSAVKEDKGVIPEDSVVLDHFFDIVKSLVVTKKPTPQTDKGKLKKH